MEAGQVAGIEELASLDPAFFRGAGVATAERFHQGSFPVASPETGRAAREMVAVTLRSWGLAKLADDVQSCVSGLIGNVRLHAAPDPSCAPGAVVTLTLRAWPRWLQADVWDADPSGPCLPQGEQFGPELAAKLPEALLPDHGRGLRLVQELADFVWWQPVLGGGKRVFCRFPLAKAAGDADAP